MPCFQVLSSLSSLLLLLLLTVVSEFGGGGLMMVEGKVLLISMDGFRWDYLSDLTGLDNFARLRRESCSVDYVFNTFATKTFPCHYSIATGLYEESHGILANSMYDPVRNATFNKGSQDPFWWDGGEPIWVTAERQGKKSGVFFWPGSEAKIRGYRPSIYKPYNQSVPFNERVEIALSWFVEENMDLVLLYFHEPDKTGHLYGPNSQEVANKVKEMDGIAGLILQTLESKKLTGVVDVILTSDHGMTEIDLNNKLLDLWKYIDKNDVKMVPDSGPLTAILPVEGREAKVMTQAAAIPYANAYLKNDIPDYFHYKHNPRVMPIIILTAEGWTLTSKYNKTKGEHEKGNHGYSNRLSSMHPIFFAWGPSFHTGVNKTSINNLDIYPLICHLLGIQPSPNNGTLDNTASFLLTSPTSSASATFASFFSLCLAVLKSHKICLALSGK